ncbi:MAG: stage V sporulation protein AD [Clostridia bacterium]|nr:stage V sporulation protein AD [Clostridia bacterium]
MAAGVIPLDASLYGGGSVVGYKEYEGPLGKLFDYYNDRKNDGDLFGQVSFEGAEAQMQHMALGCALGKCALEPDALDAVFAGDLQNQCTASAYGLLSYGVPYFGLYGACSTMVEGLLLSSMCISGKLMRRCAAIASSHNSSAERQYRTPLGYGGQRSPTAQWTVTGAASFIVGESAVGQVQIVNGMVGIVRDMGIKDTSNMGAAMAPAAADTLCRFFAATNTHPADYDGIFTGDLGCEGRAILRDLMRIEGYDMGDGYNDCGCLIYDNEKQDTHAGGSGCGCSAVVLAADLFPKLQRGEYKRILLMGTGALMNPDSIKQGRNIPGIGHLIELRAPQNV